MPRKGPFAQLITTLWELQRAVKTRESGMWGQHRGRPWDALTCPPPSTPGFQKAGVGGGDYLAQEPLILPGCLWSSGGIKLSGGCGGQELPPGGSRTLLLEVWVWLPGGKRGKGSGSKGPVARAALVALSQRFQEGKRL